MRPRVFVPRRVPDIAVEILGQHLDVDYNQSDGQLPAEEFLNRVERCDALFSLLTDRVDRQVLDRAPRLRVIGSMSVGVDHIDVAAATERGVYVTYTPGVLTEATADFTWALLMSAARRVVEADRYVRDGSWRVQWTPFMFLGAEVYGRTLGVVGLGRIGQAVARRAKGFDMKLIYYDIVRNEEAEKKLGIRFVDLETLLAESDFVTLHVPLLPETRRLIGERELRKMKRTAILVNTSRGPIVDELALAKALSEGLIAAAGLDVYEKEPVSADNPLLKLSNVVLAPHIASATREARWAMAELAAKNILAVLRGEKPPALYNPEVMEKRPLSEVRLIR